MKGQTVYKFHYIYQRNVTVKITATTHDSI